MLNISANFIHQKGDGNGKKEREEKRREENNDLNWIELNIEYEVKMRCEKKEQIERVKEEEEGVRWRDGMVK